MSTPKKHKRLNLVLPEWIHRGLKRLVADEGVTIQSWIEETIKSAVLEGGYATPPLNYDTLSALVLDNYKVLQEETTIAGPRLEAIAAGAVASEADLVRIARALDLEEEFVMGLAQQEANGGLAKAS
jgi:hypothetical protein